MQDKDFCQRLLGISPPWQVRRVEVDDSAQRVDVHVGLAPAKRSLFARKPAVTCAKCGVKQTLARAPEVRLWRHANLDQAQTYIHVELPEGSPCSLKDCPIMAPWGHPESPLTAALRRQMSEALRHCDSVHDACQLLNLSLDDVKQDRRVSGAYVRPPRPGRASGTTPAAPAQPAQVAPSQSKDIPDLSHPGWRQLAEGSLAIDVRALGLQMLLARIRTLMVQDPPETEKQAKVNELREYFVKYQRFVQYELGQLVSA